MINKIIYYSISHKFIVLLLLVIIIGGGLYSMNTINVDSTPDITDNQVQVITSSPNLSTLDIEQFITYPVELAMSNLPGVEDIRSVSRFGLSVVTVVFKEDMGTYLPRQLVKEKLDEVEEQIPEGFGKPEMGPITTGLGEIYQYTLQPKNPSKYTPQELRTMQDWVVKRQLSMIPGVVDVNSFGGSIKQYEIALSSEQLFSRHVTMQEVFNALSKNNVNTGGAYIEKNHMASFIRGEGLVKSVDDIKAIVVKNEGGVPVLISDVAEDVRFGHQVRYGAFTQNGHEAVGGMILMLKGANADKVVTAVKERIQEVQKSIPADIEIKPFLDRSNLIERTTSTIARNLIEGALIVIFVLVLLLGSVRGGIIAASVIPLALLFAFIMMRLFNVSANLMSLGAIDFGIIVDGAVIIVEGIVHKVERLIYDKRTGQTATDMDRISYESASTMMDSAFFGQLIILIVFTPILFLSGVSGKMFQPMAYTFAFAVLGALILCLVYVPVVSDLLLRPIKNPHNRIAKYESALERWSGKMMQAIQSGYQPLLTYSLTHKRWIVAMAVVLFIITGIIFSRMGGEFIPELDEGDIAMQTFLRPGSSLDETIKREEEVERLLLKNFPEIKTVCARIGVADIPTDPMGFDYTDSFIILEKDKSKWKNAQTKEELIERMLEKLNTLPGLNFSFSQPVALRFNELLTGVREDIAVKVYGEDLDTLNAIGEKMVNIISRINGAEDVALERTAGLPLITAKYDRERVARYGLDIDKLNNHISAAFAGAKAGVIFEGEKRFDMVIRLDQKERQSIEDIQNLYVDLPDGSLIPLKEVAEIDYEYGPMQISRDRASRRIYVGVNVRGRDVQSLVDEIQQRLDQQLKMPTGYHITYGGEFQNLQDARNRMTIVMPIALLLIFVLLYLALKSVRQALMIYMAVPLASIGGVLALALRGMPFSISAGIGFIVLFGVAVLNGLVLINRFNSLREIGISDVRECIIKGTRERLRPILLTATAAMLGFLPMAVSGSAGAEVQRPLATVVIGGLFSATILTLIVVPILYAFEERTNPKKMTKKAITAILLACMLIMPSTAGAQTISLQEAQQKAIQNYPTMRAARLNAESQQALNQSAFDIGETEISTGGEEIGNGNEATYTLIAVRQNFDILSIGAKKGFLSQQTKTAEAETKVAERELMHEVGIDYANAIVAHQRTEVYEHLDSIYRDFEKAAKLRYETEAASKLEYLSAQQQWHRAILSLQQARQDEAIALQNLNRWLGDDTQYVPEYQLIIDDEPITIENHPALLLANEKVKLTERQNKAEKADYLPKFYLQGGSQKIGNKSGFWTYEVGMSMPLFSMARGAKAKSGKLQLAAEQARQDHTRSQLYHKLKRLSATDRKWSEQLKYYREVELPLAAEQERVTIQSYYQGATDYIEFINNMKEATQVQLNFWDVYSEYLNNRMNLIYF
ncbi:CusA/CzcA family heavy metal efflux RND transporter [Prevotella sp. P6B1]|uniref:CusA/CzcA family heavy metal efflux RND transporter n=1 Tax=Prevotella sp. P6B1 TaxID=1410613 RepID=UPI00051BE071|nr:CusA/CzcA family heavy metal efflux RND transporter [Prevotella sp. P6B1]